MRLSNSKEKRSLYDCWLSLIKEPERSHMNLASPQNVNAQNNLAPPKIHRTITDHSICAEIIFRYLGITRRSIGTSPPRFTLSLAIFHTLASLILPPLINISSNTPTFTAMGLTSRQNDKPSCPLNVNPKPYLSVYHNPNYQAGKSTLCTFHCGRCGKDVPHGPPVTCASCGAKRESAKDEWR